MLGIYGLPMVPAPREPTAVIDKDYKVQGPVRPHNRRPCSNLGAKTSFLEEVREKLLLSIRTSWYLWAPAGSREKTSCCLRPGSGGLRDCAMRHPASQVGLEGVADVSKALTLPPTPPALWRPNL